VKFLIDECLHISLVGYAQERGHDAYYVRWLGLAGTPDWKLMDRIVDEDFTFVTNDEDDFTRLYSKTPLHAGLVILVPQVHPEQQLVLFEAALRAICKPPSANQ
jgi:predicted nuclease of predicted toxin-antitoxin system